MNRQHLISNLIPLPLKETWGCWDPGSEFKGEYENEVNYCGLPRFAQSPLSPPLAIAVTLKKGGDRLRDFG